MRAQAIGKSRGGRTTKIVLTAAGMHLRRWDVRWTAVASQAVTTGRRRRWRPLGRAGETGDRGAWVASVQAV